MTTAERDLSGPFGGLRSGGMNGMDWQLNCPEIELGMRYRY